MKRCILSILITSLIILAPAYTLFSFQGTNIKADSEIPSFDFSDAKAINFYLSLNKTGFGLLSDSPGSKTVHLADDQALDYYALNYIYSTTQNSTSKWLANQINASMFQWGGFFKYWNPVFEILGHYPNSPEPQNGSDFPIGTQSGFTINATEYAPNQSFNYSQYSDQLSYRVLLELHEGNYSTAEALFKTLNSTWDGRGFADQAFYTGNQNGTYQSYKLALFEITLNALHTNSGTSSFASEFSSTASNIALTMSELQSPYSGGVWTGYKFTSGHIEFGPLLSSQNGETTSLFVIAAIMLTAPPPTSSTASTTTTSSISGTVSTSTTTLSSHSTDFVYILIAVIVVLTAVVAIAFMRRREKLENP
ncbi:MAG: hypothetical protein ACRECH_10890 [Nitrososphaerales archaeon]